MPFLGKESSDIKGLSTINARAKSITKASTWREPVKKGRCIVPAGFAGLGHAWKDNQGHWLQSFGHIPALGRDAFPRVDS